MESAPRTSVFLSRHDGSVCSSWRAQKDCRDQGSPACESDPKWNVEHAPKVPGFPPRLPQDRKVERTDQCESPRPQVGHILRSQHQTRLPSRSTGHAPEPAGDMARHPSRCELRPYDGHIPEVAGQIPCLGTATRSVHAPEHGETSREHMPAGLSQSLTRMRGRRPGQAAGEQMWTSTVDTTNAPADQTAVAYASARELKMMRAALQGGCANAKV